MTQNALPLAGNPHVRRAFLVLMAIGGALIAYGSLPYFFGEDLHAFIIEKDPVSYEDLWLTALSLHVASALFALPACLALSTRTLVRRFPALHRWLGRVTGLVLLLVAVPSGALLALSAKGGLVVTVGFLLSALIVVVGVVHGVRTARTGRVVEHRAAMAHVTAQLSVAVTSRAMLVGLDAMGMNPDTAYVVALWVPVLASALFVELFVRRRPSLLNFFRRSHVPHAHLPVLVDAPRSVRARG